jgi:hypothetical protein
LFFEQKRKKQKNENGKKKKMMSEAILIDLSFYELEKLVSVVNEEYNLRKTKLKNYYMDKFNKLMISRFNFPGCENIDIRRYDIIIKYGRYELFKLKITNVITFTDLRKSDDYVYKFKSDKISHYRTYDSDEEYDRDEYTNFQNNNSQLFALAKHLIAINDDIIKIYEKYHHLFFKTNYLLVLTFLLCTKNTFPRDISKLIAQKIFF